jgi:hypothetical protein
VSKGRKDAFLKKAPKNINDLAHAAGWGDRDSRPKVFCFFSSEQKTFLAYTTASQRTESDGSRSPQKTLPTSAAR